jgi:ADP-ribose pyrophosphatase YjhB (NUDIX family)
MADCLHLSEALVTHPDTGALLLVKNGGKWWLPGGKVEPGETFPEAAVRETLEETNVRAEALGVVLVSERFKRGTHEVFATLAMRYVAGEPAVVDPDGKVTEVGWFDVVTAERMVPDYPDRLSELVTRPVSPHHRGRDR